MTNQNAEAAQAEVSNQAPAPPGANDQANLHCGNKVYKSGPLFLSSKVGIGWTSWKKRWFILTETSLVFYRSDPNAVQQKGAEVNLTLGGIDLNSSGSVVVKEDKKLLTLVFPDGRDGRSVTLKAETLEDLLEWKAALEEALANAPSADTVTRNDQANAVDFSSEQSKDREPAKSSVLGQPVLLALEDIDGTPSFLEKALRFMEEYGVRVEGILRQAADAEIVERRIREYEQGKTEFSPDEDAHVIGDCIKYILRELPSSPVPASCCNALLEAFRTDRANRVNNMRSAICETFPEPNRRLLQRILMMMQTVVYHKAENRMSTPAVAACMAPLLLRPLLLGECEIESDFEFGTDGSVQLIQAAAAANHAQAIVITLLEQYDIFFAEGSVSPELYSDEDGSGSGSEELTDDDESYEDESEEGSYDGTENDSDHESSATASEEGECEDDKKSSQASESGPKSPKADSKASRSLPRSPPHTSLQHDSVEEIKSLPGQSHDGSKMQGNKRGEQSGAEPDKTSASEKSADLLNGPTQSMRRGALWGRSPGKKNLSMESIELPLNDVAEILRLEGTKTDLQNKISEQAKGNTHLQENLENKKNALRERRLALEKEVAELQEQLQKERELRKLLEAGLNISLVTSPVSSSTDGVNGQLEADLKQKADDLVGNQPQKSQNYQEKGRDKQNVDGNSTSSQNLEKSTRDKESDTPVANELQNSGEPVDNNERGKGSETHLSPDKTSAKSGSDSHQAVVKPDQGTKS